MKKNYILSSFLILSLLAFSTLAHAAKTSNCITCHTNDAIIKSLFKPPAMPAGEGEG